MEQLESFLPAATKVFPRTLPLEALQTPDPLPTYLRFLVKRRYGQRLDERAWGFGDGSSTTTKKGKDKDDDNETATSTGAVMSLGHRYSNDFERWRASDLKGFGIFVGLC
jgi:hypothetical protein